MSAQEAAQHLMTCRRKRCRICEAIKAVYYGVMRW
jgi:hypothetical protein